MKKKYASDESVIQGILCSDDRALDFLYKTHSGMIRHFILTNSGTKEDAEDIIQDSIVIFYEKIKSGTLTLNSSIKTFLYAISRNLWLYKLRQKERDLKLNESILYVEVDETDITTFYEKESKNGKIAEYFRLLGESCKKILTMFYYEKISTKDIAIRLNLAGSDYVKTQKYRCLQKLKSLIPQKAM